MNNLEFDNAIGFTIGTGLKAHCNPHMMLAALELHTHQLKNLILNAAKQQAEASKILPANGVIFPKRG